MIEDGSGICCQAGALRRFGNIYIRLGNSVKAIATPYLDRYVEIAEKMMPINTNPEFFTALFFAINFLALIGTFYFLWQQLRVQAKHVGTKSAWRTTIV